MKYDVIVIGSGPGGYVAAIRAGQLGLKTAIVERNSIGGVCLNVGCIPTKALLHAAFLVGEMERAKRFGLSAEIRLDLRSLNRWKERVVLKLVKGVEFLLRRNGVEIIRGKGHLLEPGRVEVETTGETLSLESRYVILATGSKPKFLPNLKRDGQRVWSSDDAIALREVPMSLLVVGAGAVGLEFAQIYRRLGTERVLVVDIMDQVLPGSDSELAEMYLRVLKREGIDFSLSTTVTELRSDGKVLLNTPKGEVEEFFDKVLVAIGRSPNTEEFVEVGVELDEKGFVKVNDRMETNLPGVLAVGDITGNPMLAHKAEKEGILAAEVSAGLNVRKPWKFIPAVVYTYPEFATVGLTEDAARARGYDVAVGRFPLSASGRAQTLGGVEGLIKVVAEEKTGKLLGVHMLAPESSSLIGEAVLSLEKGLTVEDVEWAVHPHPTISESLMEAAANVLGRAIHILN
ncbi:MAG: dihydrolipoyl dehydrogenase [Thermotogae bacterium]|nr:dihydrolipoyl dehydrogenase [Thermotogota bacterium]